MQSAVSSFHSNKARLATTQQHYNFPLRKKKTLKPRQGVNKGTRCSQLISCDLKKNMWLKANTSKTRRNVAQTSKKKINKCTSKWKTQGLNCFPGKFPKGWGRRGRRAINRPQNKGAKILRAIPQSRHILEWRGPSCITCSSISISLEGFIKICFNLKGTHKKLRGSTSFFLHQGVGGIFGQV